VVIDLWLNISRGSLLTQVLIPTFHKSVIATVNPHGVMAHVFRSGLWNPDKKPGVVHESDHQKRMEEHRTLKVFQGIVQVRAALSPTILLFGRIEEDWSILQDGGVERTHLVCFIGEDWAALGMCDVGLTWSGSSSPGAHEARALAAGQLYTNSPVQLLAHIHDFETRAIERSRPSEGCTVC
jgi:hypothetical protein